MDALETGFALLPMTVAAAAMALLAGRLVPRLGEWRVLVAGLACGAAGATLVALNGRPANLGLLLVSTVPIGFTALAMPAMTGLAMMSAAKLGLGLSAGVFNTSRQAGGALGVAVLGTVLTAGSSVSLRPAFAAHGLRVRTCSRARRGCSRAYAGFGSGRQPVSVYGSRRVRKAALLEFIGKGTSLDEAATSTSLARA